MRTWEYLTIFLEADTKKFGSEIPSARSLKYHNPIALTVQLNKLGADGWELISAHPFFVGDNEDIQTHAAAGERKWTYTYLCVLKRPTSVATSTN